MLGETTFQPYAINTFSGRGRQFDTCGKIHYVNPHWVSSYRRSDGTQVAGYWRDGDGDTGINRSTGYWAHNPFGLLMHGKGGRE